MSKALKRNYISLHPLHAVVQPLKVSPNPHTAPHALPEQPLPQVMPQPLPHKNRQALPPQSNPVQPV